MSLKTVLEKNKIKDRHELLSQYLKNNFGKLDDSELIHFRIIFKMYYTPDKTYLDNKFDSETISDVIIKLDKWNNRHFQICVNDTWYPTSIKRLAGSNRTIKKNLNRAMRSSIESQINNFKNSNPLVITNKCPITNTNLGSDAQVDHIIPFCELSDNWLKDNKDVKFYYDLNATNYVLYEPFNSSWYNYHQENATLRWLSKEGNKIAHKL